MAGKSPRGFGAMDQDKQRQIASKGGQAAHAKGTAHQFTPEEAAAAGRKGGRAAHAKGTAHKFNPQEAAEAGRRANQGPAEQGSCSPAPAPGCETACANGMTMPAGSPEQPFVETAPQGHLGGQPEVMP